MTAPCVVCCVCVCSCVIVFLALLVCVCASLSRQWAGVKGRDLESLIKESWSL